MISIADFVPLPKAGPSFAPGPSRGESDEDEVLRHEGESARLPGLGRSADSLPPQDHLPLQRLFLRLGAGAERLPLRDDASRSFAHECLPERAAGSNPVDEPS